MRLKIEELLEEFEFYNLAKQHEPKNIYKRVKHSTDFFNQTGKTYLDEVTTHDIRKYLIKKADSGLTKTYVNSILRSIRSFYAFCEHEEYIFPSKNPTLKVNWLKEKETVIETFTDEEITKMLMTRNKNDFIQARDRLIIALLIETGIRKQSLINLKDIDIRDDFILIRVAKNHREYVVPNNANLMRLILKYRRIRNHYFIEKKHQRHDFLILNYAGRKLSSAGVELIIKRIAKQAGVREEIRDSPHTFRHTSAQMMLRNGNDIFEVSRLLGHKDIRVTETYLKAIDSYDIVKRQVDRSNLDSLKKR